MNVECPHCKARYEFDSASIPQEGYDAQCTQCANVFNVPGPAAAAADDGASVTQDAAAASEPSPEALQAVSEPETEAPELTPSPMIDAFCPKCQAHYRFEPSAVPDQGYDAQCTQCAEVFFVGPSGTDVPGAVAPTLDLPEHSASEPVAPTALQEEMNPVQVPALVTEVAAADVPTEEPSPIELAPQADDLDLLRDRGQDDDEEDFDMWEGQRKSSRFVPVVAALSLVLGLIILVAMRPPWLEEKLMMPLGLVDAWPQGSVETFNITMNEALEDNEATYQKAEETLVALSEDNLAEAKAEVLAAAEMMKVIRGLDFQREGREAQAEGQSILNEMSGLKKKKRLTRADEKKIAAGQERLLAINKIASQKFNAAGSLLSSATAAIQTGLEESGKSLAPWQVAAAFYSVGDPDKGRRGLDLLSSAQKAQSLSEYWDPWLTLAQWELEGRKPDAQVQIGKWPTLARLRYAEATMADVVDRGRLAMLAEGGHEASKRWLAENPKPSLEIEKKSESKKPNARKRRARRQKKR